MDDPYRRPETPSAVAAERRLRERLEATKGSAAAERERSHRRRAAFKRALLVLSMLSGLWVVVALVLRSAAGINSSWLSMSLLVCGIGTPLAFVFALGMKIPPRPGDAPDGSSAAALH
jgi:hypothetical protein